MILSKDDAVKKASDDESRGSLTNGRPAIVKEHVIGFHLMLSLIRVSVTGLRTEPRSHPSKVPYLLGRRRGNNVASLRGRPGLHHEAASKILSCIAEILSKTMWSICSKQGSTEAFVFRIIRVFGAFLPIDLLGS